MRGLRNQKSQTGRPISEPLRTSTVSTNVASPSLTGRTHDALNEPASDSARTQWTHPYDKGPDSRVSDTEATKPEFGDVQARTGATSTSEPDHEGDPRVDGRTASPHELMRRERLMHGHT
jgi:hypothetical protein